MLYLYCWFPFWLNIVWFQHFIPLWRVKVGQFGKMAASMFTAHCLSSCASHLPVPIAFSKLFQKLSNIWKKFAFWKDLKTRNVLKTETCFKYEQFHHLTWKRTDLKYGQFICFWEQPLFFFWWITHFNLGIPRPTLVFREFSCKFQFFPVKTDFAHLIFRQRRRPENFAIFFPGNVTLITTTKIRFQRDPKIKAFFLIPPNFLCPLQSNECTFYFWIHYFASTFKSWDSFSSTTVYFPKFKMA